MPREHYPHQTRAGRRGNWAAPVAVPSSFDLSETAYINQASASNARAALQAAINDTSTKHIIVQSDCADGGQVDILGAQSVTAGRMIIGSQGNRMPAVMSYGAHDWIFTADDTTPWLYFVDGQANGYGSNVGLTMNVVDCQRIIVDRWRHASENAIGFLQYYNTRTGTIEDLTIQRGRYNNESTLLREYVAIARPANCYELIGGQGTFENPINEWILRSDRVSLLENDFVDEGDPFQNVGQRHGFNGAQRHQQSNALDLDDRDLLIAGNDFRAHRRYQTSYSLTNENSGPDFKNGSQDAAHPVRVVDNRIWGARVGRGRVLGGNQLDDPGAGAAVHYVESRNIIFEQNLFFDNNRELDITDGAAPSVHAYDNLMHHGVTKRNGVTLDRAVVTDSLSYTVAVSFYDNDHHPDTGRHQFRRNGILHNERILAADGGSGLHPVDFYDNVFIGNGTHGFWSVPNAAGGNVADQAGIPGSTQVSRTATLNSMTDLVVEVFDMDSLDNPDAVDTYVLEDALIPASIAPAEYIWVTGNEAPAGENSGGVFAFSDLSVRTAAASIDIDMATVNGTAPITFVIAGLDDPTASASISGSTMTVNKGNAYGEVAVSVLATDADGDEDTGFIRVDFARPQVPDIVWSANSEPEPVTDPATNVNDGSIVFGSGWIGSTAGGVAAVLTGLWPVPHDIDLVRTVEALDHQRTYYREWEYTTDGTTWAFVPEFGAVTQLQTEELSWTETPLSLKNVMGLRRVATGNSQGSEWQRVTEVEVYGVESADQLNPPVCIAFEHTARPGDVFTLDETQLAALASTDGGTELQFASTGHTLEPANAGTVELIDGQLRITIAEGFSGDATLHHVVESVGEL